MTISRSRFGALLAALALGGTNLAGCATSTPLAGSTDASKATAPDPALRAAIDSSARTPANRARDGARHPLDTLAFFGLRPDQTVVEIWPGGALWWSEILAPYLADHGRYIAAIPAPGFPGENTERARSTFEARIAADPARLGRAERVEFNALDTDFVPPNSVDVVLTFRNLHNWIAADRGASAFAAMFRALKPGGVLGIEDHRADPAAPADVSMQNGYVREADAIALAQAAGFRLVARSEINANPRDDKNHPRGVWTLPPVYRLGDVDREKYAAIGESDRFTLKFVKP